jgi:mono/diheme cytochrome c family protein
MNHTRRLRIATAPVSASMLAALSLTLAGCYEGGGGGGDEDSATTTSDDPTAPSGTSSTSSGSTSVGSESDSDTDDSDTDTDTDTGEPEDCYSTRQFFAEEIWAPYMSQSCIQCHDPTGIAAEKNAKFLLLPPVYPGFMEANLENIKSFAGYAYEDVPLLLAKPMFLTQHDGGKLFDEGDEIYLAFDELLTQLQDPVECKADTTGATSFDDVILLNPVETLRKASLHLVGRLPTAEELEAVDQGGEAALIAALDAMMTEDAFYERLTDLFNDVFLTDRYANGSANAAAAVLNNNDWPARTPFVNNDAMLPTAERVRINQAVAREPLDLINYIVRNDRPFTQILTADYTVFTPDSAFIYGVDVKFNDPNDKKELQEGTLTVKRKGVDVPWPHAGILTSPMWLNRFPTTKTNRNRHRAGVIFDHFLATNVLALASQAIDPDAGSQIFNPTRNNPDCSKCHRLIDPLAGAFQMFNENDQELLLDPPVWFPEMFNPGYLNELMPPTEFPTGIRWLADRVAHDPRFKLSVVYTMYRALTGQRALQYPTDSGAADYAGQLTAWETQDIILRAIADKFVAADHNLKVVIREIIMTPYFRARGMKSPPSAQRAAELGAVGTARLSPPELLANKIGAVLGGIRWIRSDKLDFLRTDYRILYGGMDSNEITERLTDVNAVMASVAARMANEIACLATAYDFTREADQRVLFPMVELIDTPDVSGVEIKANIQHLHRQILGRDLPLSDPELSRSYELFLDTWEAGLANIDAQVETVNLVSTCQGLKNPVTGEAVPVELQIKTDPNYTVRAWMAVLASLLADYDFLYE